MGATMLSTVGTVMAGISWEPEIRGALVVLVGGLVLFGSVWLILTTNIGNRLGSLNALAGFFGWMFIMGIVWWIYGIGLRGDDPSWVPKEIVFGELDGAVTGDAGDLGDAVIVEAPELVAEFCPGLVEATVAAQRARVVADDVSVPLDYEAPEGREYCNEALGELLAVDTETVAEERRAANDALSDDDPRKLDEAALEEAIAVEVDDDLRQASQLSLSTMGSIAPELIDDAEEAGVVEFAGWTFLSAAEAGEAQATADAFLRDSADSPFEGDAGATFLVVDTFQQGGKPKRSGDGVIDRVSNEIRNTVIFWHPTNTVVVQVKPTIDKETIPGQAPPFAEIDEEGQVVSVIMVRDLGSRRLPAAIMSIGSLIIFLALCWMLHTRDLELRRRLETWDPATA